MTCPLTLRALASLLALLWIPGSAADVKLRLVEGRGGRLEFELTGLGRWLDDAARDVDLDSILSVRVDGPAASTSGPRPSVSGACSRSSGGVRFRPRYPLVPGVAYRVTFEPGPPGSLDGLQSEGEQLPERFEQIFELPRKVRQPVGSVVRIFPSADELPQNLLKFYIHFDVAMRQGVAYRHIRLLDSEGRVIEAAFLELEEELWDPAGRRFTLLFDPGRVKQGLRPRAEEGPALCDGQRCTLVIDSAWPDADGNPLKADHRKQFRVTAVDDHQPSIAGWSVTPPPSGSTSPLLVRVDEPLDQALFSRVLRVVDAAGRTLAGEVTIREGETLWSFRPDQAWASGAYRLEIDTVLEDRAGNSLRAPFEVDLRAANPGRLEQSSVSLPFTVTRAPAGSEHNLRR